MSASFHNSQQEITKLGNFMNCQNFSPKIKKIPGIPAGNFWSGGFPGIPGNSRTGIPSGLGLKSSRNFFQKVARVGVTALKLPTGPSADYGACVDCWGERTKMPLDKIKTGLPLPGFYNKFVLFSNS